MTPPSDLAGLMELAHRASAGDIVAWKSLLERLWPAWIAIVRNHRTLGPLRLSDDHVHDVMAALVERVGGRGGRGLGLYVKWQERHPEKNLWDWVRIVTANGIRDHVRQQTGRGLDPLAALDPAVKRLLRDFKTSPAADELGHRFPMTDVQTARQLLEYAERHLPPDQVRALGCWMEGAGFEAIGGELGVGAEGARKLIRAAVMSLRRRFGAPDDGSL